jgi:hypothetical protein
MHLSSQACDQLKGVLGFWSTKWQLHLNFSIKSVVMVYSFLLNLSNVVDSLRQFVIPCHCAKFLSDVNTVSLPQLPLSCYLLFYSEAWSL